MTYFFNKYIQIEYIVLPCYSLRMTHTHVSTKYQVVIPKQIRLKLSLHSGQKLLVMEKNGVIYLIPDLALGKTFGLLKNTALDSKGVRDKKDRL